MISIDLGNKQSIITDGKNKLKLPTTILFTQNDIIHIGIPLQTHNAIYDFVRLLGTKYTDYNFSNSAKFYAFDFQNSSYGKISIMIPRYDNMKNKKINIQCLVGLFIRALIIRFNREFYQGQNLIDMYRFSLIVTSGAQHPYRYALKKSCEIAGIPNCIFIKSIHSAVEQFYLTQKINLKQSQEVLCIEINDNFSSCFVYKLHPWEQKIIETLDCESLNIGGLDLTQILGNYIVKSLKTEKGIDIQKYGSFMNIVTIQSNRCKISLSSQQQCFVRVPNLPDDSTYGKLIRQSELQKLFFESINNIVKKCQQMLNKHKNVEYLILLGASVQIPLFRSMLQKVFENKLNIFTLFKDQIVMGSILAFNNQMTLFDISQSDFKVTGQEGFQHHFLSKRQDVPVRKNRDTKFPAGQLEFNLRVFENNQKIGNFLLESRPKDSVFKLHFQYDRNGIIELYVATNKGKQNLIKNFQSLTEDQLNEEIKINLQYIVYQK